MTEALARGSHDNLTAVVAVLPQGRCAGAGAAAGATERVFASAAARQRLHLQGGRRERAPAPALTADELADTY